MSKYEFLVQGRTILITGGSKGMGRSVGRQLAEEGANIAIVARGVQALEESINHISKGAITPYQRFLHISADLSKPEEAARIFSETAAWNDAAPPDIVWCCAGGTHPTLFIDTPLEQFKSLMDCNYYSNVYIAHATLDAWLRPENKSSTKSNLQSNSSTLLAPRHLIFTGSFVSFYSLAGYAPYSPTKAALRSLSDTLSQEMNLYAGAHPSSQVPPVRIHNVFPAAIHTESFDNEQKIKSDLTKMLEESDKGQTAEQVAQLAIQGVRSGHELITTDLLTRVVMTSMLGASKRGGFWKGVVDTLLSWVMVIVMVFVRRDMDGKVKKWGEKYGASGMRTEGR